ncbi:hydrogenase nickel incorporation protein HypB [Altericista sp. CCNU0014]|uniref:hydrogenase nickel incorporation protein HypB n=1 Tax=Altericista sp. CCNU0014 TaxID=3082949 RepID=UPI003850E5C5
MCTNCGCNEVDSVVLHSATESHPHPHHHHHHDHHHGHDHSSPARTVEVRERLMSKNDRFALQNREVFQSNDLLVLNILSSPGAGKTALIERMAKVRGDRADRVGVIVGDLATENDAQRIRAAGATALQITTGTACHLEADMVAHAASHLGLANLDLLVIENVGNLVCPAAYDLGETLRVVLLSVTEGEDKPLKYPTAFQSADAVLLTKTDIAEAVGFDRATAIANVRRMASHAMVFEVSARTGAGMDAWLMYLQAQRNLFRGKLPVEVVQ